MAVGVGGKAVGVCGTYTCTVEIAGGEVVIAVCSLLTKPNTANSRPPAISAAIG